MMVCMTLIYRVQTVIHILQTGSSGFNYTYQQLTFLFTINKHFGILSGSHREKRFIVPIVFTEAVGVNRPQQIYCVN